MKAALVEPQLQTKLYDKDAIVRFDEGLIGFSEFKDFVLIQAEEIKPFRLLQSADSNEIGFLVLDPRFRVVNYFDQIPLREWEAIDVTSPEKRIAVVIVNIGLHAHQMTCNFQAPLLVNYEKMTGRQIILTDSGFGIRSPLLD